MKQALGAYRYAMLAFVLAMSVVACDAMAGGKAGRESRADAEGHGQATAATRDEAVVGSRGASPGALATAPPEVIRGPRPTPTRRPTMEFILEYAPSVCYPWRALYSWPWDVFVEWGADGQILFSQGPELFAATRDGSTVWRIARAWRVASLDSSGLPEPTVGSMIPFDVAPDGGQVVFATCRYPPPGVEPSDQHGDYQYELSLVASGGGDIQRLTANATFDGYPAWSPDGRRIAFLRALTTDSANGGARDLVTVAADGGDAKRIVTGEDLNLHAPAWSPDGRRLAFVAKRELYVADADRPQVQDLGSGLLRPLAATISAPAWSPDGRRLAYAKDRGSHVGVYTIAPNGSGERLLGMIDLRRGSKWPTRFGSVGSLSWSPDGTRMLLVLPREEPHTVAHPVYVIDTTGAQSNVREVSVPGGSDWLEPRAAAWAPDGSRIAVVAESPPSSFWNLPFPANRVSLLTVGADGTEVQVLARGRHTEYDKPISYFVPLMEALGPPGRVPAVDPAACAAGGVVSEPTANPGLVQDCVALLEIQQSFRRGASLNWSVERPLAAWDGVLVAGSPPRVRELRLVDRDLGGSLPPAVGRLTDLRVLALVHNLLAGPIPLEIAQLTKLDHLDLSRNPLGRTIPPGLGQLAALMYLDLAATQLTGPIPPELGELTSLRRLRLDFNGLSGAIPPELGELTSLRMLDLSNNELSGPIPPDLGDLTSLRMLDLSNNGLSGAIPRELGQLANLSEAHLEGNPLTGCIPAGLSPTGPRSYRDLGLPRCEAA